MEKTTSSKTCMKNKISKLEDRLVENIQTEAQKEKEKERTYA